MRMPKLVPLPIPTKGKTLFHKIWTWITEVRKWELVENWEYTHQGRCYVVPKGFIFDGASIPRPLWGLLSPTGLLLIPGLIHDYGYRYDYLWEKMPSSKQGVYYKKVDKHCGQKHWDGLFYQIGNKVNDMKLINSLAWLALASMGRFAWKKNRDRNESEIYPNQSVKVLELAKKRVETLKC